jgi:hypothetical protein
MAARARARTRAKRVKGRKGERARGREGERARGREGDLFVIFSTSFQARAARLVGALGRSLAARGAGEENVQPRFDKTPPLSEGLPTVPRCHGGKNAVSKAYLLTFLQRISRGSRLSLLPPCFLSPSPLSPPHRVFGSNRCDQQGLAISMMMIQDDAVGSKVDLPGPGTIGCLSTTADGEWIHIGQSSKRTMIG